MGKEKHKSNGWIFAIIIGVIVLIAIFIFASNNSQTANNFGSSLNANTQKNCRDVQVPYQDTETYWDTESYTEKECHNENLQYAMLDKECDSEGFLGMDYRVTCNLHNLDTEGGQFIMEAGVTYWLGPSKKEDEAHNIGGYFYPNERKSYSYLFTKWHTGIYQCWCKIISVPAKNVCEDVLKYRDVQKTRTVTNYRTEQQCN